jgi:hypothetical protein
MRTFNYVLKVETGVLRCCGEFDYDLFSSFGLIF